MNFNPTLQSQTAAKAAGRIATAREIISQIDYSKSNPALVGYPPVTVWTADLDVSTPGYGITVDLYSGGTGSQPVSNVLPSITISDTPLTNHFVISPNTVFDSATGLQFKKSYEIRDPAHPGDYLNRNDTWTYADALIRAEADRTDGYADWHLASVKELTSIIDRTRSYPALPAVFNAPPMHAECHTSNQTQDDHSNPQVWAINLDLGTVLMKSPIERQYLWLCRGASTPVDQYSEAEVRQWYKNVNQIADDPGVRWWQDKINGGPAKFYPRIKKVIGDICDIYSSQL